MEADIRIARLAERQFGAFSRRQALACGLTTDEIDGRLRRGRWVHLHAGVYRVAGTPSTAAQKVLAAVLAAGDGAYASHQTAGLLWKLEGIQDEIVHITVPGRRRVRVRDLAVHRPVLSTGRDVTRIGTIPVAVPARTIIDLAGVLNATQLEDALDDALRRGLLDRKALLERLRSMPRNGRRGLPVLEALLRARVGEPITGSSLESRFRRLLQSAGLPEPVSQHEIRDNDGSLVARVDFAYLDASLAIEIDGYRYHSGRKSWERDRARQNRLVELGWMPLRITYRQIDDRPEEVVRLVSTARARVAGHFSAQPADDRPRSP